MPNIQLAKNLRTLRKASGLTQTKLSKMLNVSRQAYSNYENSKRTPDLDTLMYLTQIYDISLDHLVNHNIGNTFAESNATYCAVRSEETRNSIYLTEAELMLILKFRDLSSEDQTIISGFLHSRSQ